MKPPEMLNSSLTSSFISSLLFVYCITGAKVSYLGATVLAVVVPRGLGSLRLAKGFVPPPLNKDGFLSEGLLAEGDTRFYVV